MSTTNTEERLVVGSTGNIGIGTANPTNKLSVCNGGIKVFGAATPNINFSPVHGNSGNGDISFDGNDYKLTDNGSTNGTLVNGFKYQGISGSTNLNDGDIIEVTEVTIVFYK